MNIKKTAVRSDEDTSRRAFSPIHMDLVERLTREADDRTVHMSMISPVRSADTNKLAA